MAFGKGKRKAVKLHMAFDGPTGAGKTLSALYLAYGMTGDWEKIAVIDTERRRAALYINRPDLGTGAFLHESLEPPYTAEKYAALIQEAAEAVGRDGVIIVDSLSHAWEGEGGVLDQHQQIVDNPKFKGNSYTAWNGAGKFQNKLVQAFFAAPCHTIGTMRSKMAYEQRKGEDGRTVIEKIGLEPIQRSSIVYEFDTLLSVDTDHRAFVTKDVTIFNQEAAHGLVITPAIGQKLIQWLNYDPETGERLEDAPIQRAFYLAMDEANALIRPLMQDEEKKPQVLSIIAKIGGNTFKVSTAEPSDQNVVEAIIETIKKEVLKQEGE